MSEHLSGLNELHLLGCYGVTHEGLIKALQKNEGGIKSLSIQNNSALVCNCASPSPNNCT